MDHMRQLAILVSKIESTFFDYYSLTLSLIMPVVLLFQSWELQQTLSQVITTITLVAYSMFVTHVKLLRGDMDHIRWFATLASETLLQAIATITLTNYTLFVTYARWLREGKDHMRWLA